MPENTTRGYTIGRLARETGCKVPTIRYYEQIGLIEPAVRTAGNQRRYSDAHLARLGFIRHARDLGLPLDAIRELVELSGHPEQPCAEADRIAREHLDKIRERIARLTRLEAELERIATRCAGDHVGECYVIESLADHDLCEHEH